MWLVEILPKPGARPLNLDILEWDAAADRYRPRDNEQVNKFWMCDEGMLTYKEAHEGRIVEPRVGQSAATTPQALAEIKALFDGASPDSIAVVLSATHSVEDNWALLELGTVLIGTKQVFVSGRPDGYQDEILIHRDKNSNTRGVQRLAPAARPLTSLLDAVGAGTITRVLALGSAASTDVRLLGRAKVVALAAHGGPLVEVAAVVLPATSWAEQSGGFVNAKGLLQVSEKALEPIGSSRPAWMQITDVAVALGYEPRWGKLRQIRARLAGDPTTSSRPPPPPAE
jgi:NADH-quinone oxidoreductase subunit G